MKLKTHIGYNVYDLEESIDFYQNILGAKLEFKNKKRKSACLNVGGCEVNIFETEGFAGYHNSLTKALHIGFQLSSKKEIDVVYERAKVKKNTVFHKPFNRFDGDYSFFVQDPDGMQLEVYYGDHDLERGKS